MTKRKIQNKFKFQILNDKIFVLVFDILIFPACPAGRNLFCALNFDICH